MIIPKKIHLTCKDKNNIDNQIWKECLSMYKLLYPDYEIIVHDNADIYRIVEKHYPEHLENIKQIKIGAILADIFRYLILYLEGGIYSDLDCMPIKRIDNLLDKNYTYYHGDEERSNSFWIYNDKRKIQNKQWDYSKNICNHSMTINTNRERTEMKCLGHKMGDVSTILCYEFSSDYINIANVIKNWNAVGNDYKDAIRVYNHGICQWFMISEPRQDIFLKMYLSIMENIDILKKIKVSDKNYIHTVINLTGPSGFTKIVMDNLTEKIKIVPSDFFCGGSFGSVPFTSNSYVKHMFSSSWHANDRKKTGVNKTIYMTYYKPIPSRVYRRWNMYNKEYKTDLSLDYQCVDFLRKNYNDDVARLFTTIKEGMYKADLWRLCKLYQYSGVYADVDLVPYINLDTLDKDISFYSCLAALEEGIFQAFIVQQSLPKHPLLFIFLLSFLINLPVKTQNGPTHDMYNCIRYMLSCYRIQSEKKYDINEIKLKINIGSSHTKTKKINMIYFPDTLKYTQPYYFRLCNNNYRDKFDFRVKDNHLIVTRIDQNTGWGYNHSVDLCFKRKTSIYLFKETVPSHIKYAYVSHKNKKILDSRDPFYADNKGW